MNKTKIQSLALIILLLLSAAIWFFVIYTPDKKKTAETVVVSQTAPQTDTKDFFELRNSFIKKHDNAQLKRDPFNKKTSSTVISSKQGYALSGIATDEKGKLAILNGVIVREGDKAFDIKVLEIKKESIIIDKKGEIKEIFIY